MPPDTMVILACIAVPFVFFAGVLAYGDMTSDKPSTKRRGHRANR
ncbi:MAG: hypothetical protein ABWY13_15105 [Mesorhizobium sp.]|jgi:hypothetical protein